MISQLQFLPILCYNCVIMSKSCFKTYFLDIKCFSLNKRKKSGTFQLHKEVLYFSLKFEKTSSIGKVNFAG